jgi:IclR family KDG regulon transcriptional repressor
MKVGFKRVPAIDKCFSILEHLAKSKDPLGISDISRALNYNRSTVFNMVHTLAELGILERKDQNKFHFGTQLYLLSRAASRSSDLISMVHPYLEEINRETKLSAFLGIRSGDRAVILDKADSAFDIKIHSEVGMRVPLLAGAGGMVLLSQMSDAEIDKILSKNELRKFTRFSCVNKETYKKRIKRARREGIAIDKEEYIEGIRAFAVPLRINSGHAPVAIWAVGLKRQITDNVIPQYSELLRKIAKEIENRFASE